ncbi:MAG: hypothetical protein EZS28_056145, partial [Streblomastix strix]
VIEGFYGIDNQFPPIGTVGEQIEGNYGLIYGGGFRDGYKYGGRLLIGYFYQLEITGYGLNIPSYAPIIGITQFGFFD